MPENAAYDIECAKANVEDSIQDFLTGAHRLLDSDPSEPEVFGERLMMIKGRVQSLRGDLKDIEDALWKTIVALPEDFFKDE
jgi:hypothetical protein